jgi:hypothetical protein
LLSGIPVVLGALFRTPRIPPSDVILQNVSSYNARNVI